MSQSTYAYHKKWRYDRSQGRARVTDATRVRLHIAACLGAGMSMSAVAATAGVSTQVISKLQRGQATIRCVTEAKILAVQPGVTTATRSGTTESFVPALGTRRRIRALLAIGWRHSDISAAAGRQSACALHQQGRWVTKSLHDDFAAAYRRLSATPGPSEKTRRWAKKLGYSGPLDWDDIDHDPEPAAIDGEADGSRRHEEPDPVVVQRVLDGDVAVADSANPAERVLIARQWRERGRPLAELERLTGWKVDRYLSRPAQEVA